MAEVSYYQYEHTELEIEGVIVPIAAAFVHDEDWQPVGEREAHETWDGATHVIAPTYKRKFEITISSNGEGVYRLPDLSHIQDGAELTFHSRRWLTAHIPIGSDQCILDRDVSHGQVIVRRVDTDEIVEHVLDGRTVMIADETDVTLYVMYRPKLLVVLIDFTPGKQDGSTGGGSWSVTVREKYAPGYVHVVP